MYKMILADVPVSALASPNIDSLVRRDMDDLLRREAEKLYQEGWSKWDQEKLDQKGAWYHMDTAWYDKDTCDQFDFHSEEEEGLTVLKLEMYEAGFECFERGIALDPNHAGIQSALGEAYYFGLGVPRNFQNALEWYGKAAAQGDASAQCSLGWMYLRGHGVPKDQSKAAEWFREAARTQSSGRGTRRVGDTPPQEQGLSR